MITLWSEKFYILTIIQVNLTILKKLHMKKWNNVTYISSWIAWSMLVILNSLSLS